MEIGNKKIEKIIVLTKDDNLIALVSDDEIIKEGDFKVICVPQES